MADMFNLIFCNLDICSFKLGDCNGPPETAMGLVSRTSSFRTMVLKAIWLLSILGAGRFLLRASFAFCRDPHIAVTFIFLHLSCSQFKAHILVKQWYATTLEILLKQRTVTLY